MPHKGASTQHHNQQVLAKLHHSPSDRDQQARQKLQQKAKIRSRAYIELREETLKTVHRTFQPGVPVHLHLPALTDGSLNRDTVSQQTHPQQPEETRIHPSMLINRQVPVLNLTKTTITSHTNLQDAFNTLCVCSHGGKEDTQDQSTE